MTVEITPDTFKLAFHRNGVGGRGSYVAFFEAKVDGDGPFTWMAHIWNSPDSNYYIEEDGPDAVSECCVLKVSDIISAAAGPAQHPDRWFNMNIPTWRSSDYFLVPIKKEMRKRYEISHAPLPPTPITPDEAVMIKRLLGQPFSAQEGDERQMAFAALDRVIG